MNTSVESFVRIEISFQLRIFLQIMSNQTQETKKTWELKAESELRCEIDEFNPLSVTLLQGSAEIFGIELALNKEYIFQDENIAIFTWYGCKLETFGIYSTMPYIAEPGDTPMVAYVNTHAQLETRRDIALTNEEDGPRVMIVGPGDSGKSCLARILTAYAARLDRTPVFVDIDVSQSSTIPGSICAIPAEKSNLSIGRKSQELL